jgi:magnesium transporter
MLEHALDLHERPRIEVDEEATLLVIRAPHSEGDPGEHRYSTVPVGILLTPEAIVVVCNHLDTPLAAILHRTRTRAPGFRPEHCICGVIKDCALLFMRDLKDISARIQEVERELAESQSNEALKTLLTLQKSVTYFHAALKTNDFIIDRIIRRGLTCGLRHRLAFSEDERDVLDDALTDTRQGIYMSKIFTEVLNSITTVYSSIISNSVNQIMKLFTSITVLLMIPTLITSMYGMNIPLPLQEHPLAFSLVAGAGVGLTGAVFLAMKMRRMM